MDKKLLLASLKRCLNKAHKEYKRRAELYGYCHPYTEAQGKQQERIRQAIGKAMGVEV